MSAKDIFYTNVISKSVNTDYPGWAALKSSNCNSVDFITPNSANDSTLAAALVQSASDTLAANYSCVTDYNIHVANNMAITDVATKNALISWIDNGAKNN